MPEDKNQDGHPLIRRDDAAGGQRGIGESFFGFFEKQRIR